MPFWNIDPRHPDPTSRLPDGVTPAPPAPPALARKAPGALRCSKPDCPNVAVCRVATPVRVRVLCEDHAREYLAVVAAIEPAATDYVALTPL